MIIFGFASLLINIHGRYRIVIMVTQHNNIG